MYGIERSGPTHWIWSYCEVATLTFPVSLHKRMYRVESCPMAARASSRALHYWMLNVVWSGVTNPLHDISASYKHIEATLTWSRYKWPSAHQKTNVPCFLSVHMSMRSADMLPAYSARLLPLYIISALYSYCRLRENESRGLSFTALESPG
jgi:hypothetical protein